MDPHSSLSIVGSEGSRRSDSLSNSSLTSSVSNRSQRRGRSQLTVTPRGRRIITSLLHPHPPDLLPTTAPGRMSLQQPNLPRPSNPHLQQHFEEPDHQTVYFLSNAYSNHLNNNHLTRSSLRLFSVESIASEQSYSDSIGMRRHLTASKGAYLFPPISSVLCFIQICFFFFRHKLGILKEEDVYVSWENVIVRRQVWRLVLAPFCHFNTLNLIANSMTLFAIGRYLERKITKFAMLTVIIVMSVVTNLFYIVINPWLCGLPQSDHTFGFSNVIYSLRVLLAYALEPRNYEKDLVYGLYPMVVSASHAPWQPILDLIIFKIVLYEQCITGQLSGIAAGFVVTFVLLMWPAKGVYIANPPYYWTLLGTTNPNARRRDREDRDDEDDDDSHYWRKRTYTNSDFWLPVGSNTMTTLSENASEVSTNLGPGGGGRLNNRRTSPEQINYLQKRSEMLKTGVMEFIKSPKASVVTLVTSLVALTTPPAEVKEIFSEKEEKELNVLYPVRKPKSKLRMGNKKRKARRVRSVNVGHLRYRRGNSNEIKGSTETEDDSSASVGSAESRSNLVDRRPRPVPSSRVRASQSYRNRMGRRELRKRKESQLRRSGRGDEINNNISFFPQEIG